MPVDLPTPARQLTCMVAIVAAALVFSVIRYVSDPLVKAPAENPCGSSAEESAVEEPVYGIGMPARDGQFGTAASAAIGFERR
jgi:hypothetical protein